MALMCPLRSVETEETVIHRSTAESEVDLGLALT